MSNKTSEIGATSSTLITAVRKILYPLVRLLLHFKIVFPQLSEILKSIYVEVADKEFRLSSNKKQTDTRLSLLTGIHRKDIKRLRGQLSTDQRLPENINIGSRLVSLWVSDSRYTDKQGKPRPLALKTDKGGSFETLVQTICKQDIRPRVILDEWMDKGMVTIDNNKQVILNTQAFIPSKGFDEKAFFLGHNVSDHLSSATSNILDQHPAFFERCVYYDGLSHDSIEELQQMAREKGMQLLLDLNERAMRLKLQDTAKTKTDQHQRINIGLYTYNESEGKQHD